ncbi:hypothetical protein VTJ04DRAFT_6867 [Mycothermus thermophilus]|uniref:uncharacterized protein n=1 Tax=Humicola insolens TaxID=85995 RepID=UPI003743D2AB
MFDLIPNLLSSVASFLFPVFASYKALKTSDPAQLTPWLMYWVVLSFVVLFENWTGWILFWVPFYAYIRLLFLLYLVLPQTQGARYLYETYVHPKLEENETAIEEFIASAHARLRSAGISYLKRAIEILRTSVLGLPPSPEEAQQAAAPPEPETPQSYTQALLARFALPTPPWATTGGTTTAPPAAQPQQGLSSTFTSELYKHIASAIAATTTTTSKHPADEKPTPVMPGTLIPESVRAAGAPARARFIQTLREQLTSTMSALEREEAAAAAAATAAESHDQQQHQRKSSTDEGSPSRGGGGLTKSRSEGDFEKLDAPSGGEEEELKGVRRRKTAKREGSAGQGGGGGGWIWGWGGGGGGGGEEGGKSRGAEN